MTRKQCIEMKTDYSTQSEIKLEIDEALISNMYAIKRCSSSDLPKYSCFSYLELFLHNY